MPHAPALVRTLLFSLALLAAAAASAQDGPQAKLQIVELTAGMHVIRAELAVSETEQATGLMFRRGMAANDGMLFAYRDSRIRCVTMRNTWIALTVAFVSADGTIVSLADLTPMDLSPQCSTAEVPFALQMPQGWFARRGFKPGLKLRGPPFQSP
jgi:uncharacterized protein